MYIFQNALKNIWRNKSRNLMVGAIILAIIVTTAVSITINNTAATVIDRYKAQFSSEVFITPNTQKIREELKNYKREDAMQAISGMFRLPTELLVQLAQSEYLNESTASGMIGAISADIHPIAEDVDMPRASKFSETPDAVIAVGGNGGGDFKLHGDNWKDFADGYRSLDDDGKSRMPQADSECLVSRELAEKNNISIGDAIAFSSAFSTESGALRDVEYTLSVVGIYIDLTNEYAEPNMPEMAELNRRNEILTTIGTLMAKREPNEVGLQITAAYYLKNPDLLPQFEAEARAKGVPETFSITTDTQSYENTVKPVEGLKNISLTFMIAVIALGATILLLLASISIRERKYEIGVLRAMGMKKGKVALGLCAEILAITCVCLVIGLGIGVAASQPVSDALLKSQVADMNYTPQSISSGRVGGDMPINSNSNAKPLDEMKISIGADSVAEIILVSLLLASFAGIASISKIAKYEPIKILMERN
jgi:putative ABC transport system permease protein